MYGKDLRNFFKPSSVVRLVPMLFQRDVDAGEGTNSFRIPLASSMLFLASFRARRALTSSKPSAFSRLKLLSNVLLASDESTLDVALTTAWCLIGSGGTDPSGRLAQWPDDGSLLAFL